ncbi:NGO_0222 family membrane protein [Neisseria polysaccharea]|uniref:NGO_0222 family membrane protein n=1 Tax=Neisseria polysaccharea TaxID=489 RepID=UPI0002FD37DE
MSRQRIYLLFTALFTLAFMLLILLGGYLLTAGSKAFAVASFLFAFGALFGQIGALALYLRHKSLRAARSSPQENRYV